MCGNEASLTGRALDGVSCENLQTNGATSCIDTAPGYGNIT